MDVTKGCVKALSEGSTFPVFITVLDRKYELLIPGEDRRLD